MEDTQHESTEKLFYSIGEVSELTKVEPYVLRYWESEFKLLHPTKRSSGQRSYQKKDIDTIQTIKHLLYEELYTIAGAKKRLREEKAGASERKPIVVTGSGKDEESINFLKDVRSRLTQLQEEIRVL